MGKPRMKNEMQKTFSWGGGGVMLKLKDNVKLEELEKFGFIDGVYTRTINDKWLYQIFVIPYNRYLQIRVYKPCVIAHMLQELIYNLTKAGLLEVEE